MRTSTSVSACRHCQHYITEGRRGGQCQQLGTPVKGSWRACPLAIPPFAPSWEDIGVISGGLAMWSEPSFTLDKADATDECGNVPTPVEVRSEVHHQMSVDLSLNPPAEIKMPCLVTSEAEVA